MFIIAELARLNQFTHDPNFQNCVDQITAAQDEGVMEFDVDVNLLDEEEISALTLALLAVGYTAHHNQDAGTIDVMYE